MTFRRVVPPCVMVLWALVVPAGAQAQQAWIWLDSGPDARYEVGDVARAYFRAATDGYAAVVHVDTRGMPHLHFPVEHAGDGRVLAGRDYRVLFGSEAVWEVDGPPGIGHFFVILSPRPLRFDRVGHTVAGTWDLRPIAPGPYRDLDRAMDDMVRALLPDWDEVSFELSFATYRVDGGDAWYRRPDARRGPERPVLQRRSTGGGGPGG